MLSEVQAIQNPALGAALIWRFSSGYCPADAAQEGVPFSLVFVVLPLILNEGIRTQISGTKAGLYKLEEKYKDRYDLLYSIQSRVLAMRELSRRSLQIGIASGLLTLVAEDGAVWPSRLALPNDSDQSLSDLFRAAEKLGTWARQVSLFEFSRTLHIEF
jgi:hypothetical protein